MKNINLHIEFTPKQKLKAVRKSEREVFLQDRIGASLTTKVVKNKKKYTRKTKHKNAI